MKLYDAKLISTCDTIRFCTYKRKNRNYEISVHDYTHIRYFKNKTFDSKKKEKKRSIFFWRNEAETGDEIFGKTRMTKLTSKDGWRNS